MIRLTKQVLNAQLSAIGVVCYIIR